MKTNTAFFKIFAVAISFGFLPVARAQNINAQDSLVLVDLYNSTQGPQWTNHKNWLTLKPVSSWYGITAAAGRVTQIDLNYNNLFGKIPSSIGQLTALRYLRLSINNLFDTIPASVGNLTNLTDLVLSTNALSGSIPSSTGNLVNLQQLTLTTNQLSGVIPASIGNLANLNTLDVADNQLSGRIPSSIKNLVNLEFLLLLENQLQGSIPDGVGNLAKLRSLNLSYNQLTGEIPLSVLKLSFLQYASLASNKLTNKKSTVYPPVPPYKKVQLDVSENRLNFDILQFIDTTFPQAFTNGQAFLKIHQNNTRLSVYAGGTLSANTYFWSKAGKLVATIAGDSTFQPSEPGLYSVFIQNSIAGETLNSYNYKYTGTDSNARSAFSVGNEIAKKFIIYPNPAHNVLHIQTNDMADIAIINAAGQVCISKKISGNANIDVSVLQPGIYYLKNITTNEQRSFIISR